MRTLLFFLLIFSTSHSFAQKSPGWDLMPVDETLWVDAHETSIADWYCFVYNSRDSDLSTDSILALLPDTTLMPRKLRPLIRNLYGLLLDVSLNCNETYSTEQVSPKAYRKSKKESSGSFLFDSCKDDGNFFALMDYPITGISYAQVLAYIKWRNSVIDKTENKWICRLPSPAEWEKVARLSYEKLLKTYPKQEKEYKLIYTETGRNLHGCLLINIRNDKPCENDMKYAAKESLEGIFQTNSFFANGLGLLTLQGNVSEMTSEVGVSMGGNYTLPMDAAHFDSKQSYNKPEPWLGFRCVAQKK